MRKLLFLPLLLLLGCETHEKPKATYEQNGHVTNQTIIPNDKGTVNPSEHTESKEDRMLTQQIRQAIMNDEHLSIDAKNIKVITIDGMVTLQGQTNDTDERMVILEKIVDIPGVKTINDQLETKHHQAEE